MKVSSDKLMVDSWEWVSGHIGHIPSWAKDLIPMEFQGSEFIGKVCSVIFKESFKEILQTFYCAFGRSRSAKASASSEKTCPWSKYCLFPNSGGKPPKDINQSVFTVYSGPGSDHDPNNHAKWNPGFCSIMLSKY